MSKATYLEHLCELDINQKSTLKPKTGIICTIGPACATAEIIEKFVEKGMRIARLNFSHGSYEYHAENIKKIRDVESRLTSGHTIAIALDTQGPEIRTGLLTSGPTGEVKLKKDAEVVITTDVNFKNACTAEKIYVTYGDIAKVVNAGSRIFIDDGLISLTVLSICGNDLQCKVENDVTLGSKKGVNLPDAKVTLPAVTEKDIADLKFAIENQIDIIFASFIRSAEGIREIRRELGEKGKQIKIIAKIENQEGVQNAKEIIAEADGVMVARGDLGIEIPAEKVFLAQKMIIASCNLVGKPVICATQMLESMIQKPRPTRAEGSDVANAVLDGADCVMLSGETAKGSYPIEAVAVMNNICREAECALYYMKYYQDVLSLTPKPTNMEHTVAIAAVSAAIMCRAAAIICITSSGKTAELISQYRPPVPIFAICRNKVSTRQMNLWRGVFALYYSDAISDDKTEELDARVSYGINIAKKDGFVKSNDRLLLVTSPLIVHMKGSGHTNTLRIISVD